MVFPKSRGDNGIGGGKGEAIVPQKVGQRVVRAGSLRDPLLDFILTCFVVPLALGGATTAFPDADAGAGDVLVGGGLALA